MRIAVVYNRERGNVINLFGMPNWEQIGLQTINRLTNALKTGGHQVIAVEGDKDLVDRLEEFMPRVVKGERSGLAFNVSYGIQGQARYTHVPSRRGGAGIGQRPCRARRPSLGMPSRPMAACHSRGSSSRPFGSRRMATKSVSCSTV